MTYQPVSGIVPQYSTDDNELASGYYLKFYEANTTTPLSMATDSTGDTLLIKCKLNTAGFPISNPGDDSTVFIPHVNANYRLVIYRDEADADANNTAAALVNIPDVEPLAGNTVTTSTGTQTLGVALDDRLVSQAPGDVAGSAALLDAIGTGDLYGRDSILGTVSQSGGVPTGAIIERGSNANGEYVKFADGTMICTGTSTQTGIDISVSASGFFRSSIPSTVLPVTFSSIDYAGASMNLSTSDFQGFAAPFGITASEVDFEVFTGNSLTSQDFQFDFIVVGRWY